MTRIPPHIDLPGTPSLWRRHGVAVLAVAGVTIALGCGLFLAARSAGLVPQAAAILTLLACTAWIGLASGPVSAGAADLAGGLLRAGAVADGSIVTLLVLAEWGGGVVDWGVGVRVCLLWAALSLAGGLAPQVARTAHGRGACGVATAVLAMVCMASLFWSGGLLASLAGPQRQWAASLLVWPNPLMAVAMTAGPGVGFYWLEQPVLYSLTRMGQDFPAPPAAWWSAAVIWALLGTVLGTWAGLRRVVGIWWRGV